MAKSAQHSVHPTGGSLRVFQAGFWLEVGSGKMALSPPAHPRVTHTVSPLINIRSSPVEVKLTTNIEKYRFVDNKMAIMFGLAAMGFGLFNLRHSFQLQRKGIFTIGTVTNVKWQGRFPHVFVSFKTLKEKMIEFDVGGWTGITTNPLYQVGNPVPVLYDPQNPTDAVIYTVDTMWILPLVIIGIGLFLIYYGFTH